VSRARRFGNPSRFPRDGTDRGGEGKEERNEETKREQRRAEERSRKERFVAFRVLRADNVKAS